MAIQDSVKNPGGLFTAIQDSVENPVHPKANTVQSSSVTLRDKQGNISCYGTVQQCNSSSLLHPKGYVIHFLSLLFVTTKDATFAGEQKCREKSYFSVIMKTSYSNLTKKGAGKIQILLPFVKVRTTL